MSTRPSVDPRARDAVFPRRAALAGLLASAALPSASAQTLARTESLTDRPFTLMVPFSPGTTIDVFARLISEHLRRRLGAVAAVENRVGGSGTIATQIVARAQPDGHTLLVTTNTFVTTPSLIPGLTYDPISDFAPVSNLASAPLALCVHPSLSAETVAAFVTLARERPGRIDYATAGNGSPQHLAMALLSRATGIQLTHVPYRGSAGALQDLAAGTVPAMMVPVNSALPLRRDGRVRILAVTSRTRAEIAPDVPTLAEAGYPGLEMDLWFGLLAPARTPPAIINRLNEEIALMLQDPSVMRLMREQALVSAAGPPGDFGAFLINERDQWAKVIREANITAD